MRIGFGGGCHWCTEAVFQSLRGLSQVRQGFVLSDPPDDTWSEAVEVEFDPDRITLKDLVTVHLATHASASDHKMRGKYRSAVYVQDSDGQTFVGELIAALSIEVDTPFVTRALIHRGFKPSDVRFHDYYKSGPEKPFCQTYIDPKLAKLRRKFSGLLKPDGAPGQ
ncbi:peptide methionine sulfoxide reductase [Sulfitobacter sp. M57]|uniref:peptide-methionine (S)-S-oxide reductase n=1 Tax=unclassified Sulfitobacter TaxID=196795 RepID=UPI0023E09548|nr:MULTISPECIES: peptide-methionine (S)-S-oxide reductase [unclassified Sulfitobacter]MDF3412917.1 peptide methionine sulfoxide reductase [Sulfitobacter sp. KE5]MDF3421799.1 peptide methionine sulfoxide reductase [Sulfitobacter sp. KE43]MDF3431466.1 peptide methionine sulfoxide reductase [Sulfitobacter sp. KE42]MDF3457107.1 peptide methionine sulfoxide reductase [Sulfitobacter sp. S74]MDF3461010.1 peptide methionine sulfoxide reductase [Sulfitobacter sp. Ks18]